MRYLILIIILAQKVELRHKKIKSPNKEGEGTGPRALRRRKGRMTRIRRRSSINGHWYDRETAVFTPPKVKHRIVTIFKLNELMYKQRIWFTYYFL